MQDYVSAQTYARARPARASASPGRRTGPTAEHHAVRDREQRASRTGSRRRSTTRRTRGRVRGVRARARSPARWFNEGWKDFANWATPTLAFGNAPATLTAGAASAALTVRLQLAGVTRPDTVPVTVSLSSTRRTARSPRARAGPWSATLDVPVPAGSTDAIFYYRDTKAGVATIGASAPGTGRRRASRDRETRRSGDAPRDAGVRHAQARRDATVRRFRRRRLRQRARSVRGVVGIERHVVARHRIGDDVHSRPSRDDEDHCHVGKADGSGECEGEGHAGRPRHPDHVCAERESPTRLSRRRRLPAPSRCTRLGAPRAETRRALGRVRNSSHELARARDRDENGETRLLLGEARARQSTEASAGIASRRRTASA